MTIRYDDKGKFFTDVISKDPVPVVLQTLVNRIEGNIYARPDERLADVLNKKHQFIPMTDVIVKSLQGKELYRSDFLLINSQQVVWLLQREIDEDTAELPE